MAQIEQTGKKYKLVLSRESKVFELNPVNEYAKVVLVYINSYSVPSIWLYSSSMIFNYLAEDFTTYFRMCIAHLGVPCWQYIVTKEGIPEWNREMIQLIAPGILGEDRNLVEMPRYNLDDGNKIDPNIFIIQSSLNYSRNQDSSPMLQAVQQNKIKEKKTKPTPKRHVSGKTVKKAFLGSC
ncbi:hypothetical protein NQ317_019145 [Molorchus minor]|uniref:Uncharacterized protein n=1 Tax=Molorchus minor TaxID=1323400 RepID=A0ABQ9JMV7_9CUCU|nr:hypothetical protein NQ317_019145 [Molorchus minor]